MEDLGINDTKFLQNCSSKGSFGIALPSGGDAYWFLVVIIIIIKNECQQRYSQ